MKKHLLVFISTIVFSISAHAKNCDAEDMLHDQINNVLTRDLNCDAKLVKAEFAKALKRTKMCDATAADIKHSIPAGKKWGEKQQLCYFVWKKVLEYQGFALPADWKCKKTPLEEKNFAKYCGIE